MCDQPLTIGVTAPDFRTSSGGVFVLHYLAKLLHDIGHDVVMPTSVFNPEWGNYATTTFNATMHFAVFPEISTVSLGNVARWCLNAPGKLKGPTVYGTNEHVWFFNDDLKDVAQAASFHPVRKLFLPSIDQSLLPMPCERRTKEAYYVGKYRGVVPPMGDAIAITKDFPATRKETYQLLSECSRVWVFDDYSFLAEEALQFCGNTFVHDATGEWVPYVSRWPFERFIMDHNRDIDRALRFVMDACEVFNL